MCRREAFGVRSACCAFPKSPYCESAAGAAHSKRFAIIKNYPHNAFSHKGSIQLQTSTFESLIRRPRRNRKSSALRSLVQETFLQPSHFVAPLFVVEGERQHQAIASMPGVYRFSIDLLLVEVIKLYELGIRAIDLFCLVPEEKKDAQGSLALQENNILFHAIHTVKKEIPEICVMVDIALDPFTSHGHDGVLNERQHIDNDLTLDVLAKMSVLAAEAGADVMAPSDMMDGRVAHIRNALDQSGFTDVSILSYAAKYASSLYGPFREALASSPKFGDKKSYQLNPANVREALLECSLDEQEAADFLLIKPALAYLDVIAKVRANTHLPLGAYLVSGEYAMIMAAAQNGWLDGDKVFMEHLLCIKRAGADFIFTYGADKAATLCKQMHN